jgi:glycosyltransferase involved in cell wall biosynthesis
VVAAHSGVDIGMPTRGSAPWIATAVESILAQTYTNWTLVISENGPPSAELAEMLSPYLEDERVSLVATGADLGPAVNHTRLVQQGTRPYVAILHDDDLWEPEFLERRVAFLEANRECGFVFGRHEIMDERGDTLETSACSLAPGVHSPEAMVRVYLTESPVGMTSLLVQRTAYETVGGEWASMPWMDLEMWFRIVARFPTGYIDVVDSKWRRHSSQWTARVGTWGETLRTVYGKYAETLDAVPELTVDRQPLQELRAGAALQAALDATERGDRQTAQARLREAFELNPRSRHDHRALVLRASLGLGGAGVATLVALRHASWKFNEQRLRILAARK